MENRELLNKVREYIYSEGMKRESFLSEREIAKKFELARSKVREILLSLEGEGVLARLPQKGYRYIKYGDADPRCAEVVRYTVEREAVRKAIGIVTREDLVRLTLILEETEAAAASRDVEKFRRLDIEFHTTLIAASRDPMLIRIFSFFQNVIFQQHHSEYSPSFDKTLACHHDIFNNFKAGDWKATHEALRTHLVRWPE